MLPGRTQPAGPVIPGQAPSQQPVQTVSYEQSTISHRRRQATSVDFAGERHRQTDEWLSREQPAHDDDQLATPRATSGSANAQPANSNQFVAVTNTTGFIDDRSGPGSSARGSVSQSRAHAQRPYQPATPAQSYGAWSPNTAPMASSLTINANMVTAPGAMPVQLAPPFQNAAQNTTPHAGQPPALQPSAQFSSGPTQSDEYPGRCLQAFNSAPEPPLGNSIEVSDSHDLFIGQFTRSRRTTASRTAASAWRLSV